MATERYLRYIHTNTIEDTLEKFFHKNQPLVNNITIVEFLRYKDDLGETNATKIFNKYTETQISKNRGFINQVNGDLASESLTARARKLPVNTNTELMIPKSNFNEELISIQGKNLFLKQDDFKFFFADKLFKLMNDPRYIKAENLALEGSGVDVEVINENVQVWIWVRALNKILNVSSFVQDMTTQKSDVGTFSITLNPIHDIESVDFTSNEDVVNYFSMMTGTDHDFDFFHKNIQYNDIVFIRFERLEIDNERKESFENKFEVNKSSLPGQVWDMIGLVDYCAVTNSHTNTEYNVSVEGRDLMKLMIEDGSYFMPLRFIAPKDKVVSNNFVFGYNHDDKWFKRNFITSKFDSQWFPISQRSIGDTVGFIINQLSNLGVLAGEDLFSAYGDARTTGYKVSGVGDKDLSTQYVDGLWQIIKVMYDKKLEDRRVGDASIAYVDSSIIDQFNKICQKPFVEMVGDTYGDEFNLVVRQPPFNKSAIQSFLKGINDKGVKPDNYQIIDIEAKDLKGYNELKWDDTFYSWYQLTPNDAMLGSDTTIMAGGFIPIVYFERIAEMYGNQRLVIPDNYLFANIISADGSVKDNNTYRRSLLNDLKYIVDSNVYLPFTRKGSLSLIKGDRRIKRGTFIRVKPTNEIFYVDSVSNTVSFGNDKVDRSTTIQVSRGMIEDYVYGEVGYNDDGSIISKSGKDQLFSYFDIARTGIVSKSTVQEVKGETIINTTPIISSERKFISINAATESYRPIVQKYFPAEEVDNALRIIFKESTGNPLAAPINSGANTRKGYLGSKDHGLFQINDKAHPDAFIEAAKRGTTIYDPYFNIEWGYKIWRESKIVNGNGWMPWVASRIPGVIYKSSYYSQEPEYKVTLGKFGGRNPDFEEAISRNNPGSIKKDGVMIDFLTPEEGYEYLLEHIQTSEDMNMTVEDYLKNLTGYSLTFGDQERYLRISRVFSGQQNDPNRVADKIYLNSKLSAVDHYQFSKDIIFVMTNSKVEKIGFKTIEERGGEATMINNIIDEDQYDFSINDDQLDFFVKRKQFNLQRFKKR